MRLNLTQHTSTPEQDCTEPGNKSFVQELLTFEAIPNMKEIWHRAETLALLAEREGATEAMIGGAPFLMPALELALLARDITPLYAFSRREVVEEVSGKKTAIFRHLGFVKAGVYDPKKY